MRTHATTASKAAPIRLTKFNPHTQLDPARCFIGINGRPNSGKTILTIDLIRSMADKVDDILVVSESLSIIRKLRQHDHIHPLSFVHVTDFPKGSLPNQMKWEDPNAPFDAVRHITNFIKNVQERFDRYQIEKRVPRRVLLVLDDCGFDKTRLNTKWMKQLFSNYRQMGIGLMIICQNLYQLPKDGRQNLTHAATFRVLGEAKVKEMWKAYFDAIDKMPLFRSILHHATAPPKAFLRELRSQKLSDEEMDTAISEGPRGVLIIDMQIMSNADHFTKAIKYFVADGNAADDSSWRVGNPNYHRMADEWFKDEAQLQRLQEAEFEERCMQTREVYDDEKSTFQDYDDEYEEDSVILD